MTDVFISYSRKDADFVRRLHATLEDRGHDGWVDWDDIPPSDIWMERIHAAIDQAQAIVFVISPDSVASPVCAQELDYAISRNKRLIPVFHRDPEAPVQDDLSRINYVFARTEDPFDTAVDTLIQALTTDLDWVRAHTRLLVRATEWDKAGREASLTLRGQDLTEAENWAAQAPDKDPKPTALQSQYLLDSRRAQTRRQRTIWASVAAGLVIAATLGTVAWFQNQGRERQQAIAVASNLLNRAEALRDTPIQQVDSFTNRQRSLNVATRGLARLHTLAAPTDQAMRSVRKSLASLPFLQDLPIPRMQYAPVIQSPNRRFMVMVPGVTASHVWDLTPAPGALPKEIAVCTPRQDFPAWSRVSSPSITNDGRILAIAIDDQSSETDHITVIVWRLPDCQQIFSFQVDKGGARAFRTMALTPGGKGMILRLGQSLWRHDLASGQMTQLPTTGRVRRFAISPDGTQIASAEADKVDGEIHHWVNFMPIDGGAITQTVQRQSHVSRLFWTGRGLWTGQEWLSPEGADWKVTPHKFDTGYGLNQSADGSRLAWTDGQYSAWLFDFATGRRIGQFTRRAAFEQAVLLPDNRTVGIVDNLANQLTLWRPTGSDAYARLKPPSKVETFEFLDHDGAPLLRIRGGDTLADWTLPPLGSGRLPEPLPPQPLPAVPAATAAPPPPETDGDIVAQVQGPQGALARIVTTTPTRGGMNRFLERGTGQTATVVTKLSLSLDQGKTGFLAMSPDGAVVATATNTGFEIRRTAKDTRAIELFHGRAVDINLPAGGERAATVDDRGTVRIWSLANAAQTGQVDLPVRPTAIALAPDGRWLAALHADGQVTLWALRADDLIAQACGHIDGDCP